MQSGDWRYAQASAIGLAHLNQNTECQDRAKCAIIETSEGEVLIAAVSDGAGSTTHGQIGAEIACRTFLIEASSILQAPGAASVKSISRDFGVYWLAYFQKEIEKQSQQDEKTMRDYASTFIGAVIGSQAAVFFQIGDGAVVYSLSGQPGSYLFGFETLEPEYVNMTDFLTDDEATGRLHYNLINEKMEDLILFSDGIYPIAVDYQTNRPHEPFLIPMMAPLRNGQPINNLSEKLEKFLSSPKVNEKTDDDKTIILASRHKLMNQT